MHGRASKPEDPFILWWMPIVALLAPLIWAAWEGVSADSDAFGDFAFALVWPGVVLYFGTLVLLWAGWKIDLE